MPHCRIVEQVEYGVQRDAFAAVTGFRAEMYASLFSRGGALFQLCDALLCTDGPVRTLVDLALAPERRRGHGALYADSTGAGSTSNGSAEPWSGCHCPGPPTGVWCSRWTSLRGCGRTRTRPRIGPSSMPATMHPGSRTSWPTCRSRSWVGSARTE